MPNLCGSYSYFNTYTDCNVHTNTNTNPDTNTTPTATPTPTSGQITLSAHGYKVQGLQTVDLSWTGGLQTASTSTVTAC